MRRVVVIGGSFAGSITARRLENKFSVTLIDKKDYFEFTPGILRIAVKKDYNKNIRIKHSDYLKKAKIIIGEVREIGKKFVIVGRKKIGFDYLVIASGARYAPSDRINEIISAGSSEELWKAVNRLEKAKSVLIIGGGIVGVELAGEICTYYKDKEITIINKADRLISRNHPKAIKLAHKFLEKKGVKLLLNDEIVGKEGQYFITNLGEKIDADIAFNCIGSVANSSFMKKNFFSSLDGKGSIKVNDFLQVEGENNIFAGGDVSNLKEEKTAQAAMKHGGLIARNIIALHSKEKMRLYSAVKRTIVISLGRWFAIFDGKKVVFSGIIPALIKWGIERKIVWRYKLGLI